MTVSQDFSDVLVELKRLAADKLSSTNEDDRTRADYILNTMLPQLTWIHKELGRIEDRGKEGMADRLSNVTNIIVDTTSMLLHIWVETTSKYGVEGILALTMIANIARDLAKKMSDIPREPPTATS